MTPEFRLIAMAVTWGLWVAPFFLNRAKGQGTAARIEPRARFGIVLTACGFFIVNTHGPGFWNMPLEPWRMGLAVPFGLSAIALSWTSAGNLGKQWRVDAGLNTDHELVQSGAYRIVRHPIYLSILLMMLTNTVLAGTLPGWPFAIVLGVIGTEIRVRVEDGLLQGRFGERFTEWQERVPAWLPLIR
jgi:protein-S-isoprenylcysteine O-methyltransferase Ste14